MRAIAGGVILFFWAMIYGVIIMGVFIATGGSYQELMSPTGMANLPDWFWASVVLSPNDTNQMAIMQAFNLEQVMGIPIEAPGWLSMNFLLIVQMIWIIVP